MYHGDTERKFKMNSEIKKITAITAIFGIATILLLIVLMMGYSYTFVKIWAGINMLMFLLSGIGLVITKTDYNGK